MKAILGAVAISLLVFSGASALPITSGKQVSNSSASDLIQIGKKDKRGKYDRHDRKKYGDWHRGKKYGRYGRGGPPPGWRSYSYRPWGWERRGCLLIGPLWYCP
jgi:hypothetical protein